MAKSGQMFSVSWHDQKLRAYLNKLKRGIKAEFKTELVKAIEKELLPSLRKVTPKKTGALSKSYYVKMISRKYVTILVLSHVKHAIYVELGTKPHWIGANVFIVDPSGNKIATVRRQNAKGKWVTERKKGVWRFIGQHPGV